ncbi:hypothetical protein BT96DRAFT_969284 [Gymnopus androsaceus JB14]|uniref:DUF7053 domain-containing protein n=1 Tax=Gymnopus androsaceus JB14 TaxID=1447944 RepID=A0A6A4IKP5_9AGAR|nr:hypothetical protein BT96DRAFT_969284 [Gymnopus androsaceus JB14]
MDNGWPFFLTHDKSYTKVVPDISEDDLLTASDPSQPNSYTFHEVITLFKIFKAEIVCNAHFTRLSDGTDERVKAGAWTTLHTKWRVRRIDTGEIEVSEVVTIRCIFLFMPFIISTIDGAQSTVFGRLVEKAKKGNPIS